jgi:N-acetylglucosamine-6-phosphate deacetylase
MPDGDYKLGSLTVTKCLGGVRLEDGTLAGSTLTMDRGFRNLVTVLRQSVVDAAAMCASTPASQLGLGTLGRISPGMQADLVVLDREFQVVRTFVAGAQVWPAGADAAR